MTRQKGFGVDSTQIAIPQRSPAKTQREAEAAPPAAAPKPVLAKSKEGDSGMKSAYLIAGGTALVAVGVATYFMLSDSPETTEKTYVVE